ncbi:tetratricopeptide repeat protein [Pontibacter sp. 13R65]
MSLLMLALPALQVSASSGGSYDHEQLMQRAEFLLNNYKETEALRIYEEVLALSADNFEALCKASLLHNRIGDRYSANDTRQMEHFSKAKDLATRAHGLNPTDAETNYLMALSMSNLATVLGPKQRLEMTNQVKNYLDAALACRSDHAGAWHLMGRWQYKMANLNFAEIAASKMFFGGIAEKTTNSDAIQSLQKAIAISPQNIRYYYDLATIYQEMKEKEACVNVLKEALTVNMETKEEYELSRRCKIMLEDQAR